MAYFSEEDIIEARKLDLLTYLKLYEPRELVRVSGNTYSTREHGSLKISNGKWMWWSHRIGGVSALDYLIKVRGMPFPKAVKLILGRSAELPSIGIDELTGDVREYRILYKALLRTCPVPVVMEEIEGGAKGYYNDSEKRIAILAGMSEMQTIKTIIHEMAHQKMHAEENADPEHPVDRRTKEVEAESVAYTVCQHLGLDTSDYSFGYIAGWSSTRDTKELKASLERIRSASDELITEIDKNLEHFRKREQEKLRGEER